MLGGQYKTWLGGQYKTRLGGLGKLGLVGQANWALWAKVGPKYIGHSYE